MMKKIFFVCMMVFIIMNTNGQKVGLVLSGGGAKGLAHIGVIKALEENEIPIDYITGTSMGAIIGGLYAIGMSPGDMQELVTSREFENWATGKIENKYLYYFKKEEINAAQFNLKIAKKDSTTVARLPTNIIPTHGMDFTFMEVFAPANAYADRNFDNLFVPFRCVASDIYNNKPVILKNGDLGSAIRASMTFPFYFKPISIDSTLLFDGGMHNNFPFDVMMDCFDPDFIIGSKTANNSIRPDEENILSQIENMLLGKSNFNIPEDYGLMIETSLEDIGLLDMHKADSIITAGYKEANKNMDDILKAINRRKFGEILEEERQTFKEKLPKLKFRMINIQGVNDYQKTYIENCIRQNEMVFGIEGLREEYYKLLMDDKLSSIYPTAVYNKNEDLFELNLNVKVETQFEVELGGNISSSSNNQGYAGLEYKQLGEVGTKIHCNLYFGRLYNSFMMKTRLDYPTKIPFYIEGGITLNRWDYFNSNNEPFFEDYRPGYVIQNEGNIRINVGLPVKTNSALIASTSISNEKDEYYQSASFSRSDTNDISKYNMFNYQLKYEKNTLNYPLFPNRGEYQHILFGGSVGEGIYTPGSMKTRDNEEIKSISWINLNFKDERYFYLTSRLYVGTLFEINLSSKEFFNNYTGSIILANAFKPTLLSKTIFLPEYRAYNYTGFGLLPGVNVGEQWTLKGEGYLFLPYRKIFPGESNIPHFGEPFKSFSIMGGLSVIYQSPFGPASISMNYFEKEGKKMFIQFNFGYILFNKRGNQ